MSTGAFVIQPQGAPLVSPTEKHALLASLLLGEIFRAFFSRQRFRTFFNSHLFEEIIAKIRRAERAPTRPPFWDTERKAPEIKRGGEKVGLGLIELGEKVERVTNSLQSPADDFVFYRNTLPGKMSAPTDKCLVSSRCVPPLSNVLF